MVDLIFSNDVGRDVVLQSVVVFAVSELPEPGRLDWRAGSLTDFGADRGLLKGWAGTAAAAIATAIQPENEEAIDSELVHRIVGIIYARPSLSMAARSAVVRMCIARLDIAWVWADVWRDSEQIDAHLQREMGDVIWDAAPRVGLVDSILPAFCCQNGFVRKQLPPLEKGVSRNRLPFNRNTVVSFALGTIIAPPSSNESVPSTDPPPKVSHS
jgi:hypothetical protein